MSSDSLYQNDEDDENSPKKLKSTPLPTQSEAGTSKPQQTIRKKSKKKMDDDWGYFPPEEQFWKQEVEESEPQQEEQLKNLSTTPETPVKNKTDKSKSQQKFRRTESQNFWPSLMNIQEPQRIANQPTLDQIIEQKKIRGSQLLFAQQFSKDIDYLADRISQTKLNILIAQLSNILPSTSHEEIDSTKTLFRAKPLHLKSSSSQQLHRNASKVSKHLTPEEITQQEHLRQNQLQEYENLRDQVSLLGARSSSFKFETSNIAPAAESSEYVMEETISKTDLNKLVHLLNEMPNVSKDNVDASLQNLIQSKPQIVKVIKEVHKKTVERSNPEEKARQQQLRQKQMPDQEVLNKAKNGSTDLTTSANMPKPNISKTLINENLPGTKSKKLVKNESDSFQKQETSTQFHKEALKIVDHLTPEELARRKQLRQNQIQEYEKLREQIGLFGETTSDVNLQDRKEFYLDETISNRELNLLIKKLNEEPFQFKTEQNANQPSSSS